MGDCGGGPGLVPLAGDRKGAVERLVGSLEFLPKGFAPVAGMFSFTRGVQFHSLYSFLVGEHMVQSISKDISSVGFYVW